MQNLTFYFSAKSFDYVSISRERNDTDVARRAMGDAFHPFYQQTVVALIGRIQA